MLAGYNVLSMLFNKMWSVRFVFQLYLWIFLKADSTVVLLPLSTAAATASNDVVVP
jgi:hypothetical protein